MKTVRATIFLSIFVFALGAFALQGSTTQDESKQPGHDKQGHMATAEAQLKHLTEELNLTATQQTAAKAILDDTHKQAETVMADKSLSQEDRRAKMRTMHEAAHAKFRELLNDEQKKKFDDMRSKMEQQHK
jgi:periplasmic protein CpxP/Spy